MTPRASLGGATEIWSDRPAYQAFGKAATLDRILVVKADHIGDLILGIDAMLLLRRAFPAAHMTLACAPWSRAVAADLGIFDAIHVVSFFGERSDQLRPPFAPAMLRGLDDLRFDLAIDLRVDPDTRVILDHIEARWKCGYASAECRHGMTLALPHALSPDSMVTLGDHQMLLLSRLAQSVADLFRPQPQVGALLRERLAAPSAFDLGFADGRVLIACNTGSGRAAKNWPIGRFRTLLHWLVTEMDAAVLLLGTGDQAADADSIVAACGPGAAVASAIGRTTLNEAIGLMSMASIYLGNDTGLTHIAARLGIPTVAIFSGIDPTGMWAPVGPSVTVIKAPVPCSPCHILVLEDCRHEHACIRRIGEEAVRRPLRLTLLEAPVFRAVAQPCASSAPPASRDPVPVAMSAP